MAADNLDDALTALTRTQCMALLGQASFGRIGVTVGALPAILPVYFRLQDERVIIRAGWGDKLKAAVDHQVVCFQADGLAPDGGSGWSVLVTGEAVVISDVDRVQDLQGLSLPRWASGGDDHYVQIGSEMVSGRRVALTGPHHLG